MSAGFISSRDWARLLDTKVRANNPLSLCVCKVLQHFIWEEQCSSVGTSRHQIAFMSHDCFKSSNLIGLPVFRTCLQSVYTCVWAQD